MPVESKYVSYTRTMFRSPDLFESQPEVYRGEEVVGEATGKAAVPSPEETRL